MGSSAMNERVKDILSGFFVSVTLINVVMLILGKILGPDQTFGYEVFMYPLIYGFIGAIPGIVISGKKELSVSQVIIRKIMQLLLIIVLMFAFMFGGKPIDSELVTVAIFVSISIVIVFVLVNVILWWLDMRTAGKMTDDLLKYQQKRLNRQ